MDGATKCLNCENEGIGKYCSHCGQSLDTHRLSFGHFIAHDLIHGTFHLDKGLIFTIKQILIKPGYAALDYIKGKRKSYYNFFYLILLLIGFYSLIGKFYGNFFPELNVGNVKDNSGINDFFHHYIKFILIGFIPIISFNSFVLYRKAKLNFLEHVIVSVLAFLGVVIAFTAWKIIEPLKLLNIGFLNSFLSFSLLITVLIYTNLSFYQVFKNYYSKKEMVLRFACFIFLVFVEIIVFLVLLVGTFMGRGELILNI